MERKIEIKRVKTRLKDLKDYLRVGNALLLNKEWKHKLKLRLRE